MKTIVHMYQKKKGGQNKQTTITKLTSHNKKKKFTKHNKIK